MPTSEDRWSWLRVYLGVGSGFFRRSPKKTDLADLLAERDALAKEADNLFEHCQQALTQRDELLDLLADLEESLKDEMYDKADVLSRLQALRSQAIAHTTTNPNRIVPAAPPGSVFDEVEITEADTQVWDRLAKPDRTEGG